MNYIHKVERPEGSATRIEAQANGVSVAFIKGKDGRPREVSRSRGAMVYDQSSLYIPKVHYAGMVRQVAGVFADVKKSKQLGFQFNKEA